MHREPQSRGDFGPNDQQPGSQAAMRRTTIVPGRHLKLVAVTRRRRGQDVDTRINAWYRL